MRRPTGKKRDRVWYLDAAAELAVSDIHRAGTRRYSGAAVTISKQHGATSPITGLASLAGGEWADISGRREEDGGRGEHRSQDYWRLSSLLG